MVCPSDQSFVEGGSEERRRLYDTIISQYDSYYLDSLMRYNKTLQQRNSLLKQEEGFDLGVMEVLEDMMSEDADYIYKARQRFTQEISPIVSDIYRKLCNTNDENIVIGYESHCDRGYLKPQLVGWREKEKIVGYTLHGIHKDDMIFELNGYSVRREGSQGQTKTFCIAVKLAQYLLLRGKGEMKVPILLLDDIFDKLDHGRVERIIEYVSQNDFGQIFITDTDYVRLNKILEQTPYSDYRFFEVEKGKTTTNIIHNHEA
jgi:DNA replication and repair protein RecF